MHCRGQRLFCLAYCSQDTAGFLDEDADTAFFCSAESREGLKGLWANLNLSLQGKNWTRWIQNKGPTCQRKPLWITPKGRLFEGKPLVPTSVESINASGSAFIAQSGLICKGSWIWNEVDSIVLKAWTDPLLEAVFQTCWNRWIFSIDSLYPTQLHHLYGACKAISYNVFSSALSELLFRDSSKGISFWIFRIPVP